MHSCFFNFPLLRRIPVARTWSALALTGLLLLAVSLGGCAGFDPARISVNVDPDEFTTIGW